MTNETPIAFKKVKDAYGWFSNMSPHPVKWSGETYPTAEHLFQALRFDQTNPNHALHVAIRAVKSPMAAKMHAKANKAQFTVEPRSGLDVGLMMLVVGLKIEQYPDFKKALLETNKRRIIEDVTSRPNESGKFWGAALENGQWVGQNALGLVWEHWRAWLGLKQAIKENNENQAYPS
jgi:ribA/ribD-fused uncharacterized protein